MVSEGTVLANGRPLQVLDQMKLLDDAITNLEAAVNRHEDRVARVLSPIIPQGATRSDIVTKSPGSSLAPLADDLAAFYSRINQVIKHVKSLSSRAEV